jgi:hypothetical protein
MMDFNYLRELLVDDKTGFDWSILTTINGKALFRRTKGTKYVITKDISNEFWRVIDSLGLDRKSVYIVRSNEEKIQLIKRLGIDVFYDTNPTVRSMLPSVVRLF